MNWTKVGLDKTEDILPRAQDLVWIYTMEDEVDLGFVVYGSRSHWWCLWTGSDDIHVAAWAPIDWPPGPDFGREWIEEIIKSYDD